MKNTIFLNVENKKISDLIFKLKNLPFGKTGTRRICIHKDLRSSLHVMMVSLRHKVIFPIHYHKNCEFIFQIAGKLKIKLKEKKIKTVILDKKKPLLYIDSKQLHSTEALTENCIYLEFTRGPFKRSNSKIVNEF